MNIYNLSETNSLLGNYINQIRSVEIQKDSMRFRRNIERIASIMSYEVSKTLDYKTISVNTPLATANVNVIADKIVVASVLRAGLPFHNGVLEFFDNAENCFVSAYRKYTDDTHFKVNIEYMSSPSIEGKTVILCDPMLATGASMHLAYKAIMKNGNPKRVIICSVISSEQAINYIQQAITDEKCELYTAVIDPELNEHKYIVPGIGDAGDLCFGEKLDNKDY